MKMKFVVAKVILILTASGRCQYLLFASDDSDCPLTTVKLRTNKPKVKVAAQQRCHMEISSALYSHHQ